MSSPAISGSSANKNQESGTLGRKRKYQSQSLTDPTQPGVNPTVSTTGMDQPYISPKMKAKISLGTLRSTSKNSGPYRIGAILKLPQVVNGVVRRGEVRDVKIRCTITENRVGRMQGNEDTRSRLRFVYIADCTGFLSLRMVASETDLRMFDVDYSEFGEETRCVSNAAMTGKLAWIPKRSVLELPTFFLNNGTLQKMDLQDWMEEARLMLPTSDFCRQMVKSRFARSAHFTTTGFCGKVDLCCENLDGDVWVSLEDPVGYAAVKIECDTDKESADKLKAKIKIGMYLVLMGALPYTEIYTMPKSIILE